MENRPRNLNIDLIKIIAMIGVVCLHTTYAFTVGDMPYIAQFLYRTAVISIPLFFMVSGYLLLGRESAGFSYSFRKILKIVRFVFIFVAAYWLLYAAYHRDFTSLRFFVYTFVGAFIQRGYFAIFWYFGAMCILYMLHPLLNHIYIKERGRFYALVGLLLLLQSTVFILNLVDLGEQSVYQPFRLWNWITYFLLGGLLKRVDLFSTPILATVVASLLILNPFYQQWLIPYIDSGFCEYFYCSPFIVIWVSAIFLLVNKIKITHSGVIAALSRLFLPVYVIHPSVIRYLPCYKFDSFGAVSPLVYFCTVLLITMAVSYVVMKIPVVNRIFRL
ncbi:MAG: acyltransferase family protein [Muribaculaceae bacterium]|nr:acyltransferase family protein [Muribaculaceae bacterium]